MCSEETKWFYINQIRDPLDNSGDNLIELMDYYNVNALIDLTTEQCKNYYYDVFCKKVNKKKEIKSNNKNLITNRLHQINGFGIVYRRSF